MRMPASIFHMPNTSLTKNCSNRISHEERSYRRNPPLKDVFLSHDNNTGGMNHPEERINIQNLLLLPFLYFDILFYSFLFSSSPSSPTLIHSSYLCLSTECYIPCLVATETTMSFLYNNMVWYNKRKRKERFLNSQKLVSQYLCSNVHTFAPQERSSDPIYSHFAFK